MNPAISGSGSLSISRNNAVRAEGLYGSTSFSFLVQRSGPIGDIIETGAAANWAVTGGGVAATSGIDGTDVVGGLLPSGHVVFAPGETSKLITVFIAGDSLIEVDGSFTITLLGAEIISNLFI